MSRKVIVSLSLLVAWCLVGGSALGAEDPEALIRQGNALRKEGDNLKAQGYFQRAYEIAKTPRTAAQLGLVEFALEQWLPSETHLSEALAATGDLWVEDHKAALNDSLAEVRGHLARLTVTGSPPGARVMVAGVDRGVLPLTGPVYVAPGAVVVSLSTEGHGSIERMVDAREGQAAQVELQLSLDVEKAAPTATASTIRADTGHSSLRPVAWGTAIGAAVLLAGGGIALALSDHDYTEFNNRVDPTTNTQMCFKSLPNKGGTDCQQLLSGGDRDKTIAIVGLSVGAAAAVASAIFFGVSADAPTNAPGTVACLPDYRLTGAACVMRF